MTETTKDLLARLVGFTPGKWKSIIDDCGQLAGRPGVSASADLDCSIVHWDGFVQHYWRSARGDKEIHANAALIAAAPDLHRICTDQQAEIARLRKELRRLETYFNIDPEEYAALPKDYHRADNDRQLILIRKALGAKP
jgi:hypothetical protein